MWWNGQEATCVVDGLEERMGLPRLRKQAMRARETYQVGVKRGKVTQKEAKVMVRKWAGPAWLWFSAAREEASDADRVHQAGYLPGGSDTLAALKAELEAANMEMGYVHGEAESIEKGWAQTLISDTMANPIVEDSKPRHRDMLMAIHQLRHAQRVWK